MYIYIYLKVCVRAKWLQSQFFVTLWTVAHQAPLSMGFSRQEFWSGLPCPPPVDLPHTRTEPKFLISPALAGGFFTTSATGKPIPIYIASHLILTNTHIWRHSSTYRVR